MAGVEARLATISGLRTSDIIPDQINPPCAIVGVPDVPNYRVTMARGFYELDFTVTVLVSAALDRIGQIKLAGYMNPIGATSIITAIEGDKTLGGAVADSYVRSFRRLGIREVGEIGFYGGEFVVYVVAGGQ